MHVISIVVPLYNEAESLDAFYEELCVALRQFDDSCEIIFVDDGSTDNSLDILKDIEKQDKRVVIFSFRKNHGKAEALNYGFVHVRGKYVITLDADLQDKPSEITEIIKKLDDGWDAVCGWRKNRRDAKAKVIVSGFFNLLARKMWRLSLHDYNCGLKGFQKEAAQSLNLYGGLHRFIPLLLHQQGFRVCEVEVEHEKRKFGKSKFGFSKVWRDLPDMFTIFFLNRYSDRPLHFFGMIGGLLFISGVLILMYLVMLWLQGYSIGRRPLLLFGILVVLSGLQIFFTGFLADLIISITKKSSTFDEKKIIVLLKYTNK